MRLVVGLLMRDRRRSPVLTAEEAERQRAEAQAVGPAEPAGVTKRECDIHIETWDGLPVYTVTPKGVDPAERRVMLYLHGGGYSLPIQDRHWDLVGIIARQNALTVVVPLYELAPEGTHRVALDRLVRLYQRYTGEDTEAVTYLAGDSSGGGLAFSLAQRLRDDALALPHRLVLFSPWLDLTLRNPAVEQLIECDPIIDVPLLRQLGRQWAEPEPPESSAVNPIYGDLTGLPPVDVFVGTRDLLIADCRLLASRAEEVGTEVNLYEYCGAFHVFMWIRWLPETRDVLRRINRLLRREPAQHT